MTGYEISEDRTTKSFLSFVSRYLNFSDVSRQAPIKKENLIFGAWFMTGKHLRKALKEYEQEGRQETQQGKVGRGTSKEQSDS